ncbi:MAG: TIGR01777 family oxidoreductase [Desulfarculaceae bacterium]|nr:TIGR01777 family oxidoreductase [Desulfarculaceae bacterium]
MKTIAITGASGFVGTLLSERLCASGYRVTGIGRSGHHPLSDRYENFSWVSADTTFKGEWQDHIAMSDSVVNLAGRSIFGRWTSKYKKAIYDSRIQTTKNIVDALEPGRPARLISASAVGYYGDRADETLTEEKKPGSGFLAKVCVDWEKEAVKAEEKSVSVAVMRFGVVLGRGGALSKMLPAFRAGAGGPLAGGRHWMAWIHMADLLSGILFLLENQSLGGSFNFTAPGIVRQKDFAAELGRRLNRPAFLPMPGFAVGLMLGELGDALTQSQHAVPQRLEQEGFVFDFPDLGAALREIIFGRTEGKSWKGSDNN